MIADLVRRNRSCRRFFQSRAVSPETLRALVDLGRLSASGGNLQPLKYMLSWRLEQNEAIFKCLAWAGYLKDWSGPPEGEKPAAYIVVLADSAVSENPGCDHGIAAQSILLGARETGLAGCLIGTLNRERLRRLLSIPQRYAILLVVALGEPKEEVVIEPMPADGSVKYWRDERGVHHVPKRSLDEVIIE